MKVIYKYRNSRNYFCYKVFIFLGQDVPEDILKILNKIQALSLSKMFQTLNRKEYADLREYFNGDDDWYIQLYNKHHITHESRIIIRDKQLLSLIQKKFNIDWSSNDYHSRYVTSRTMTTKYADLIRISLLRKEQTKVTSSINLEKKGGAQDDDDDDDEEDGMDQDQEQEQEQEEEEEIQDDDDEIVTEYEAQNDEEEINLDDVTLANTDNKSMKEAAAWVVSQKQKTTIDYEFEDDPFENFKEDQELFNVSEKIYIFRNRIDWLDTIHKIKEKVCDSIRLASRFPSHHLIPSRTYMWSEYYVATPGTAAASSSGTAASQIDRVMLGSKWIQKSELWDVRVEPSYSIQDYIDLTKKNIVNINYAYKKHGMKIKREDDDLVILRDYFDYVSNDEIFMTDVCSLINKGTTVPTEKRTNLINTFIRVYFPTAVMDTEQILEYLAEGDGGGEDEITKMTAVHKTLREDLALEREVDTLLDSLPKIPSGLHQTPYITQAVVQLQTRFTSTSLNLGKIFESFMLSKTYPYIRMSLPHEEPVHKIFKFTEGLEFTQMREYVNNLRQWTGVSGFGMTIKVLIGENPDQYLTVGISDAGRILYKIQFKEANEKTLATISDTYPILRALLHKINEESSCGFQTPDPKEYGYVFINGIMKLALSKASFLIDHNDLSDFARYFFPYVAVVVDPKKRTSKNATKSTASGKWGTYLRFKKVSNYDDPIRILRRVLYYVKNYEVTEAILGSVIEAEFNIPHDEAQRYIQKAHETIATKPKAMRLKKLDPATIHHKQRGIAIEIQGKTPDSYKMRFVGAKNQYQFEEVVRFMTRFLTLYEETYFTRIKARASLQKKLISLTNVAKRRNLVMDVVIRTQEDKEAYHAIKQIKKLDPDRFIKSTDNYTKACQNSGKLIRRPQQIMDEKSIRSLGYKFDARRNVYFRIVTHPQTKKKTELLAVRFEGPDGPIFYVCDPRINGNRMFVGILSKSSGTLPCCFQKRQDTSSNPLTRNKYLESVGMKKTSLPPSSTQDDAQTTATMDQLLYIKHASVKVSHERYHFLPEVLDYWMNQSLGRRMVITSKLESTDGYLFMYGIVADEDRLIRALGYALNMPPKRLRDELVQALKKDTNERLFTSLGQGSIRLTFPFLKTLTQHLATNPDPDTVIIMDIVRFVHKINIIIFDPVNEGDFVIRCNNTHLSPENDSILLIRGIGGYSLICEVVKTDKLQTRFRFPPNYDVMVSVRKYYDIFCRSPAHDAVEKVVLQFIDSDFRAVFLLTASGKLLPTIPSGASPTIDHKSMNEIEKYTKSVREQLEDMKPYAWIVPVSLMVNENNTILFLKVELVVEDNLQDYEVLIPVRSSDNDTDIIDMPREEYTPMNPVADEEINKRKFQVNLSRFREESYQRFRLALSWALSKRPRKRQKIISLIKKSRPFQDTITDLLHSFVHVEEDPEWAAKRAKEIIQYRVQNVRSLCSDKSSLHCHNKKMLMVPREWVREFVKRVTIELGQGGIPGKEILKIDDFLVSEVIDTMSFTNQTNQIMVRGANINLKSIVSALFGQDSSLTEVIGETTRQLALEQVVDDRNPLVVYEDCSVQAILENNFSILRGCVNGFYYLTNQGKYPEELLNLGYTSTAQTVMTNFFKGKIVTWLKTYAILYGRPVPQDIFREKITTNVLINIHKDQMSLLWKLEVWAFHQITKIPVIILGADDGNALYLFQDGNLATTGAYKAQNSIVLRVLFSTRDIPQGVKVIYRYSESIVSGGT